MSVWVCLMLCVRESDILSLLVSWEEVILLSMVGRFLFFLVMFIVEVSVFIVNLRKCCFFYWGLVLLRIGSFCMMVLVVVVFLSVLMLEKLLMMVI